MYFFFIWQTDSTQNHSKALQKLHSTDVVFWIHAGSQISGRGQRGKKWTSIDGNLFLSGCFLLPQTAFFGRLAIIIGVSLAKILKLLLPNHQIGLKWPNDVLCENKKVGGVLIEIEENRAHIGIGINVSAHPSNTDMPATHLLAYGDLSKDLLIEHIIETIFEVKDLENFQEFQDIWWAFAKDSIPFWKIHEGIEGRIIGIDEEGKLLMQDHEGCIIKRYQALN